MSALHRVCPPLRQHLPFAAARLKCIGAAKPPQHHLPLPWYLLIELCHYWCAQGLHRRAGTALLQWLFGLRPSEVLELTGSCLTPGSSLGAGMCGFLRLGRQRGTKAGRPQIARAHSWDPWACYALDVMARVTPKEARLCEIALYRQLNVAFAEAARALNWDWIPTPHCSRAGWASWRYARGQAFSDLCEDARWRSAGAARVYLDCVSSYDLLRKSPHAQRLSHYRALEASIGSWWAP